MQVVKIHELEILEGTISIDPASTELTEAEAAVG